jgi:hypothetical protein
MLHHHKKHWLFHATMWVCAVCVLLAFCFVSWKFSEENKWLVGEVDRLTSENKSKSQELSMCLDKKNNLEKSVDSLINDEIKKSAVEKTFDLNADDLFENADQYE